MISTGKSSSANCPPIFIRLHRETGGGVGGDGWLCGGRESSFDIWRRHGEPETPNGKGEIPHCSDANTHLHSHQHTFHPNAVEACCFYCQGPHHSHPPGLVQGTVSYLASATGQISAVAYPRRVSPSPDVWFTHSCSGFSLLLSQGLHRCIYQKVQVPFNASRRRYVTERPPCDARELTVLYGQLRPYRSPLWLSLLQRVL